MAQLDNSVYYTGLMSLIRNIRESWKGEGESEGEIMHKLHNFSLLIIDEVGVQNGTENERNILFEIIDGRYQEMKPTIIISNLGKDEISNLISQRSVDRITQGGAVIPFTWESHRSSF